MKAIIAGLISILCLVIGFLVGTQHREIEYSPPRIIEVEVPVYIDKPVYITIEQPVYIDKPVYEAVIIHDTQFEVALEPFRSLTELKEWLKEYEEPELPNEADCDDRAVAMFLAALSDGKFMSTEVVESQGHMVCSTIIDNKFYFIQNNKSIFRELGGTHWKVD